MMSLGDGILNCPQPSYETQTELKEIVLFHHEQQLYEDILKSGEVAL